VKIRDLDIPPEAAAVLEEAGYTALYPPQEQAVRAGALRGENLLLAVPTAAGKTLIAELCMVKHALEGGKALYLAPLRALAAEKRREFTRWEKLGLRIGVSTGDHDSAGTELASRDIIVCTYERAESLLRHRTHWIRDVTIAVADEVHLLASDRGPTLEIILTLLRRINPHVQIVALSATVGNSEEVAHWLQAQTVKSNWRPVPLREGVYWSGEVAFTDGRRTRIPPPEPTHTLATLDGGRITLTQKKNTRSNETVRLVLDSLRNGGQVLVFEPTRRSAEATAHRITRLLNQTPAADNLASEVLNAGETSGMVERLADCVRHGVAFHHAGLDTARRRLVENWFRTSRLRVLCATPTLAAGVNLPARRVIIKGWKRYDPNYGWTRIPVSEYKQMAGRAGRPDYDAFGEAILVAGSRGEAQELAERYIASAPEPAESRLANKTFIRTQVLALIASGYARTLKDVTEIFKETLYAQQAGKEGLHWLRKTAEKSTQFLKREEMITEQNGRLEPTRLGARVSSLYVDPESAATLRKGAEKAAQNWSNPTDKTHPAKNPETETANTTPTATETQQPSSSPPANRLEQLAENLNPHDLALLHLVCCVPDMPILFLGRNEAEPLKNLTHRLQTVLLVEDADNEEEREWRLAALKTALLLAGWITETSEATLCEAFNVGSGDIHRFAERAEWLLYAAGEIARLLNHTRIAQRFETLRQRVKHGVREELLP